MTSTAPSLDLLVVGGLTIDRFPDGSSVAGGSVLHIARAAASRGLRIGVATAAGPEPETQAGLADLRRRTAWLLATAHPATTTFRHRASPEGRRLWLERRGGPVALGAEAPDIGPTTHSILYAPVAGEVPPEALTVPGGGVRERGAILQGWLRSTDEGAEVEATSLAALRAPVRVALSELDLLVASREDLVADAADPRHQLDAMRRAFGRRPTLVITDGADGVWIGTANSSRADEPVHLPVPWRVDVAHTVGAGDIFAAFMLAPDRDVSPGRIAHRAEAAMRVVAQVLEERRGA